MGLFILLPSRRLGTHSFNPSFRYSIEVPFGGSFMRFRRFHLLPIPGALVFLSLALSAQTFRGGINGTVSDAAGAVIPQAKVVAKDNATAAAYVTTASGSIR
jgi:hypothetical protein